MLMNAHHNGEEDRFDSYYWHQFLIDILARASIIGTLIKLSL